ncbi:hypothetical protein [Thiorhodovibrio winogradskyi]|uniref:hypothetical protein n=1 Tax=Thiorhodovibrio winogradskyi TaxID=77007 RepID=UPI002E2E3A53|nr:hypothetical protein [Thiorhodovibrio winogradskyi]
MFSDTFLGRISFVYLTLTLMGPALAQVRPPAKDVTGTPDTMPGATLVMASEQETLDSHDTNSAGEIGSNPLNDLVRIFAGLEVAKTSPHADLMNSVAWADYHQRIQQTWQRYKAQQHDRVEAFRDQWLPAEVHQGRDLLYPFAGADFLYADLFFPQATNTFMFGLEPLGDIPGRERLNSAYYNGVIRSTEDLLRLTFFRTKAMREDFQHNGTVPLLGYFIVHRGHVIQDITYLRLDEAGIPHQARLNDASGARITFQDGRNGRMRSIWYWRGDLSNQGLASAPGLAAYIAGLPPSNLYMKAASYLCHHQGFEDACTLFRDRAELSLQEDSGMPLRFFPEEDWNQTFFGQYRDPISIFTDRLYRQQGALKQAFATSDSVHYLPFPLGYHASAHADNLMLAMRKQSTQQLVPGLSPELPPNPTPADQPNAPMVTAQTDASDKTPTTPASRSMIAAVTSEPATPTPLTYPANTLWTRDSSAQANSESTLDAALSNSEPLSPPASLQQQLDAAGLVYKINDSGTLWLIYSVDNSRTQLTFIAPETKNINGQETHEIWSVGFLSEDDTLSVDATTQLLKDNAATDAGAWELGRFLGKAAGIFRTRIPASANWQTLSKAVETVATTADQQERALMGADEL